MAWLQALAAGAAGFAWYAYFGQGLLFITNMPQPVLNIGTFVLAGLLCGLLSKSYVHALGAGLVSMLLIFTVLGPVSTGATPAVFLVFISVLVLMLFSVIGEFIKGLVTKEIAWLCFGAASVLLAFTNMLRLVNPGQ